MYRELVIVKKPSFLVITPLKPGDVISKQTTKSISNNKTRFDWISYESDNNIPTNTTLALEKYEKGHNAPKLLIKVDNDILADGGMLDDMVKTLEGTSDKIGYCYPPFKYILPNGKSIDFPYTRFDEARLLKANYITSVSMIKNDKLKEVGGFVTDNQYCRLLDWCL